LGPAGGGERGLRMQSSGLRGLVQPHGPLGAVKDVASGGRPRVGPPRLRPAPPYIFILGFRFGTRAWVQAVGGRPKAGGAAKSARIISIVSANLQSARMEDEFRSRVNVVPMGLPPHFCTAWPTIMEAAGGSAEWLTSPGGWRKRRLWSAPGARDHVRPRSVAQPLNQEQRRVGQH